MISRLSKQYDKTDPGIVVALIMTNCLRLQPGQSIYTGRQAENKGGN